MSPLIHGSILFTGLVMSSVALAQSGLPAQGTVNVAFQESAPKDRFILTNASDCPLIDVVVTLNLEGSSAGLLFDTESGGPGVNVFQPLEVASGGEMLAAEPHLQDGATQAVVRFKSFDPGRTVILTVDVDDTVPSGPRGDQMIALSEIQGAGIRLDLTMGGSSTGVFDQTGMAVAPVSQDCGMS